MKIGIGVCTYKRPEMATKMCKQILNTIDFFKYSIQTICSLDDTDGAGYEWIEEHFGLIKAENKGVAVNKNRLLKYLKNCDVVFIIEDDIIFVQSGWIDLYLKAITETKIQHFNYIVEEYREHISSIEKYEEVSVGFSEKFVNGVFMVFTKECLKKVGGFDTKFKCYGYEHADYTRRCTLAKVHPEGFVHVIEAEQYIEWEFTPSVLSEEEKNHWVKQNSAFYCEPIVFTYLPYSSKIQSIYHFIYRTRKKIRKMAKKTIFFFLPWKKSFN